MIDTDIQEQMSLRQEVLQILFKKFGKGDYSNKSIVDSIKSQAIEAVTGSLGGGLGGDLPVGAPDLVSPTDSAAAPQGASMGLPVPNSF